MARRREDERERERERERATRGTEDEEGPALTGLSLASE
jgi:hypothetical protein